jgi:hypothetical protein
MNNPKAQFNIPTDSGPVPRKGSPAGEGLPPFPKDNQPKERTIEFEYPPSVNSKPGKSE